MNSSRQTIGAAALALALAFSALSFAADQSTLKRPNAYEVQQNMPAPKQGTHESRKADRKAQRALARQQANNGEMPQAGDDWGMNRNRQEKAHGTHETRAAERRAKRKEVEQWMKAGDMPVTSEADVSVVKKR